MKEIRLSDSEWKVMTALWRGAPKTITQLVAALKAENGWSKSTVITLLKRMEAKGAVRYEEGERARRYFPNAGKEQLSLQETENFMDKVFGGSVGLMMSALVDGKGISAAELDELQALLDRAREEET